MNIKGIGVDIEEIKRFKSLPYKSNRDFYNKIFTDKEIRYCLSKSDPYPHFTARFAAKEAVSKALNQSVYRAKSIEISNDKTGKPLLKLHKDPKSKILISLSHTKDYAIAFAIVQW